MPASHALSIIIIDSTLLCSPGLLRCFRTDTEPVFFFCPVVLTKLMLMMLDFGE